MLSCGQAKVSEITNCTDDAISINRSKTKYLQAYDVALFPVALRWSANCAGSQVKWRESSRKKKQTQRQTYKRNTHTHTHTHIDNQ